MSSPMPRGYPDIDIERVIDDAVRAIADGSPETEIALNRLRAELDRKRCETMRQLSRRLDGILHAATALIGLSITIRGIDITSKRAIIRVEACPLVSLIFAEQCAMRRQFRDERHGVMVHTWCAVLYGVRIEWEIYT